MGQSPSCERAPGEESETRPEGNIIKPILPSKPTHDFKEELGVPGHVFNLNSPLAPDIQLRQVDSGGPKEVYTGIASGPLGVIVCHECALCCLRH